MRKPLVAALLLVALLICPAGAGAVLAHRTAASPPAAGAPAPAAPAPAKATTHWRNIVLAGKSATADGSVLMGYNNDWSASNYAYLQVVPGDATHYLFVKLLTMGGVAEGGINVHQLGALYGTATTLDKTVLAADPCVKKGCGGEIWDLILQQCTTAQQALALLQQMVVTGFTSGAAGSFAIGDPSEVWLFELLGGHHWAAERVPDNAFLAHPNMVTIRQVNLVDTNNFRGSATSVPSAWAGKTAYNSFRAVADSLDKTGKVAGEIRYKHYIPLVQSTYGSFETTCAGAQAATDNAAAGLNGTARSTYLTNYSAHQATQALSLANGRPAQMP